MLRAVGKKGKTFIEDQLMQQYQTSSWGAPSKLVVERINEENDIVTIQVKILDNNNVPCLDASNWIQFSLAGDGALVDDLGTSSGSSSVQAYNGVAIIKVETKHGKNVVCVQSPSLPTSFLVLEKKASTP